MGEVSQFDEWFDALRLRIWKDTRADYDHEPMYSQYLMLLRPYFQEVYNRAKAATAERDRLRARLSKYECPDCGVFKGYGGTALTCYEHAADCPNK